MFIRGIVQTAGLAENPPGSDVIEMVLKVQGVGPGQPRTIVVPLDLLVADPTLDPESVAGHGFEAEVVEAEPKRWVVESITFAGRRVLRSSGE
jgi:hypothetical protein